MSLMPQWPHGDGRFLQYITVQANLPESLLQRCQGRIQDGIRRGTGSQGKTNDQPLTRDGSLY